MYALSGDSLDCFHELGVCDRALARPLIDHNRSLLATSLKKLNRFADKISRPFLRKLMAANPSFAKHTEAYAEGLHLGHDPYLLVQAALIPELASAVNVWAPRFFSGLLGCSSFFMWDDKRDALVHGRILDFPLMGSFDNAERALLTQFNGGPKILSFGSAGFPYPSLTCQTSEGMTFALHQKFTQVFDPKGTPIFELVLQMLQSCGDLESVLQFLKKSRTLTCWGFYMGFQNGEVLAAEMAGSQVHTRRYQLGPKEKMLYFSNQVDNPEWSCPSFLYPLGSNHHNQMRCSVASKKIAQHFNTSGKRQTHTMEKLARLMSSPWTSESISPSDWESDNLTPSSLQIVALCPAKQSALFVPGPAPKHFQGKLIEITNAFGRIEQKTRSLAGKREPREIWQGWQSLMAAQMALQTESGLDRHHMACHHLQMAEVYFKGHVEESIARFFVLAIHYLDKVGRRELEQLLSEFEQLESKLPAHLEDHRLLFIARLERRLQGGTFVRVEQIQNQNLQKLYHLEKKIPHRLLYLSGKYLIIPRLDLLDIVVPLRL